MRRQGKVYGATEELRSCPVVVLVLNNTKEPNVWEREEENIVNTFIH